MEPVEFSKWAAPTVQVVKPNRSLRICEDNKMTVDSASKHDKYPLPQIAYLFFQLEERRCPQKSNED